MNDKNLQQQRKSHILIVDDDTRILKLLKQFFEQNNFLVSTAISAKSAEELLNYFVFDLMILDVMLPNVTGFDFARNIRSAKNKLPIIMLTALGTSDDRITGLEAGASDYLTKPFEPRELLLRVQNLIEIYNKHQKLEAFLYFGNFCYNKANKLLTKQDLPVSFSDKETELFHIFATNQGKLLTRSDLLEALGTVLEERTIDVQINRLRTKIEADPKRPIYLKTIRNKGYIFLT